MLSCSVALYLYTYQVGTKTWFTLVSLVLDCTSLCLAAHALLVITINSGSTHIYTGYMG